MFALYANGRLITKRWDHGDLLLAAQRLGMADETGHLNFRVHIRNEDLIARFIQLCERANDEGE